VSYQRRRGVIAKVWKTKTVVDNRGNVVKMPDLESEPELVTVAQIPQRSARAEVPGQAIINVVRIIVNPNLTDVNLWSRVEFNGKQWDLVTPPSYHHGTRHTRHWSIDLRERP
jgi:hypothetical protein